MKEVKVKPILVYVLVPLLGVCAALTLYFYQTLYRSDSFLPGVHIAAVNVSGYDQQGAAELLAEKFEELFATPISFYSGEYKCEVSLKDLAALPDLGQIILDVWEQEEERSLFSKIGNLNGSETIEYPVKITYDKDKLNSISSQWQETLEQEAVNAQLEIDPAKGLIVLPSQNGITVDIESTIKALPVEWQNPEKLAIEIKINEEVPAITESQLQNMGELAAFSTWYNPGLVGRSHNVVLATKALNTTMLKPQEIFSFNKRVGPRSVERGYRDAMVIVGDKFEEGLGGGICQVSSTLYNACLLAGLKIVERHNHNLAVAYVPLGQDATVAYGLQDFRFQNNFNEPIYIWAQAYNGKVTMKIYGALKNKQKITVNHVVDQVIDFKEIRETKEDMPAGTTKIEQNGSPGYVVRSFRTFYNSDGSVNRSEQLARDNYRPLNKLVYQGPPLEGAPPENGEDPNKPKDPNTPGDPETTGEGNNNENIEEHTGE